MQNLTDKQIECFYSKAYSCPICENVFQTLKPKTSRLKVLKRDTDFCTVYEGFNPKLYHVSVCPNCGYAATESHMSSLRPAQQKEIREHVSSRWIHRDYGGLRTVDDAIICYKLALVIAEKAQFSSFELAILSLNLAWIYRGEDNKEQEMRFLNTSKAQLIDAYAEENYGSSQEMTEGKVCYLIGELSRRTNDKKNAAIYMEMALRHADVLSDKSLLERARDQWILIKEM